MAFQHTIRYNGIEYQFSDKWCRWNNCLITYDIEDSNFNLHDVSLEEKLETIVKTHQVKKLFRTVNRQESHTTSRYFLTLTYKNNSYSDELSIKQIEIYESIKAHEIFNFLKKALEDREKKLESERLIQKEISIKKTEQERERLANCIYDIAVIDFETTGVNNNLFGGKYDEILAVSIIDQDENVLLSTLCKPESKKSWPKAQAINSITPSMVRDKPTFSELLPQIKEILNKSKIVIAYNIDFESKFLWLYDAANNFPGNSKLRETIVWGPDPMLMFSAYKGAISKYGDIKWQKLTTAAKNFKYDFVAHNSLEDVKATLFVYKKLIQHVTDNPDKDYIFTYGYSYDYGRKAKWLNLNDYSITGEIE